MRKKLVVLLMLPVLVFFSCNGDLLIDAVPKAAEEVVPPPTMSEIYNRGIWMVGGQSAYDETGPAFNLISQIDIYDPVTNAWYANVTELPVPVTYAGVAAYQGKLYVAGGFDSLGANTKAVQVFDTATGAWTTAADIDAANRANFDLMARDGYLYATAGTTGNHSAAYANADFWRKYNIQTNIWAAATDSNSYMNAQVTNAFGIFQFLGGRTSVTAVANAADGYIGLGSAADALTSGTVEAPALRVGAGFGFYYASGGTGFLLLAGGFTANMTGVNGNYLYHNNTTPLTSMTNTLYYLRAPFEGVAWTLVPTALPQAVASLEGIVVDGLYYLFGGIKSPTTPVGVAEMWKLDLAGFPASPVQVEPGPDMPIGRFGHKAVRMIP